MSTRSKKDRAGSSSPLTSEKLALFQKQTADKERRLREKNCSFEQRRRELEARESMHETMVQELDRLRREIEDMRKMRSSVPRHEHDPLAAPLRAPPRHNLYEYDDDSENVSGYALKEATAVIPTYDGQNMTVLQFTRTCKLARDMILNRMEKVLTKLTIGKLRGRAYSAIEDVACETIGALCERLKDVFGPQRTVDQYCGDLANIYTRPSERIMEYISRVKDLHDVIIDCDRANIDIGNIDNLTTTSFINDLNHPLSFSLRPMRNQPPNAVFDEVIQIFKQLQIEKSRTEKPTTESRRVQFAEPHVSRPRETNSWRMTSPSRERTASPPSYSRMIQRSRSEHTRVQSPRPEYFYSSVPRYEPPHSRSSSSRYELPQSHENFSRQPPPTSRFCQYCKIPSHDVYECREKQYNNAIRSGNAAGLPSRSESRREAPKQRVQIASQTTSTKNRKFKDTRRQCDTARQNKCATI